MAKFVIECPSCGNYAEGSNFIFAKKKIKCSCGNTINVHTDKLISKNCAHCGNNVLVDQTKGADAICPICKEKVNTSDNLKNKVEISCPQCNCLLGVDKSAASYTCPVCDTDIDVQASITKEKMAEKGLASLIKYEGSADTLVWKHPVEDFNTGSQLIVHESQEALFFRNGEALDLFPAGRYTLETEKLPILSRIMELPTGEGTFHSEVYFINMATHMGIKWGTDSKVRLFDPESGLHVEIGASGEFNLRVNDPRKLVIKLVGTGNKLDQTDIIGSVDTSYFKALIMMTVKSHIAQTIKQQQINILEIDARLDELSAGLKAKINDGLIEYGLIMPEFFVTTVVTPDDDPNFRQLKEQYAARTLRVREEEIKKAEAVAAAERKLVEAETEAKLKVVAAQSEAEAYRLQAEAEAQEMRMKGYTYAQETARQVGVAAVSNESGIAGGAGGMSDIVNLGVGLGAMSGVLGMTKDALNPIMGTAGGISQSVAGTMADTWNCTCGQTGISANFCSNCGTKRPALADTWNCSCGQMAVTGNFCSNCGAKRPEPIAAWNCTCGQTGITGNFCSGCGAKRPEPIAAWNCKCGQAGITGNFCSECGSKKEDN